jgi:hypothetical protein
VLDVCGRCDKLVETATEGSQILQSKFPHPKARNKFEGRVS